MILLIAKMLAYGLVVNWPGVLLAVIVLLFLLISRSSFSRAISYSCFALIGGVVARFQWFLLVEQDTAAKSWALATTIMLVSTLSVIALVASARRLNDEIPLQIMLAITFILAVMQFGGAPLELLNWYARIYSLACMLIPPMVAVRDLRERNKWNSR